MWFLSSLDLFVLLLFLFMNFERLQAVFLSWYFIDGVPQLLFVENIRTTKPTTFWVYEKHNDIIKSL